MAEDKKAKMILDEEAWKKAIQSMKERRPFTDADTLRGNISKRVLDWREKNWKNLE